MATIVVHGTMTFAAASRQAWWWNSWHEGGFLAAVSRGMTDGRGRSDLWRLESRPVSEVAELNPAWSAWTGRMGQFGQHKGHFMWDGADMGISRSAAASNLAKYLNTLHAIAPREPIRIIAHSHGCNVVKLASAQKQLRPEVRIHQAALLACPHFAAAHAEAMSYQMSPERFGAVLNLYSTADTVQTRMAEAVKGVPAARIVDHLPQASHRRDQDRSAARVYRDFEIPTQDTGVAAHSAMHGAAVGYMVGRWLSGAEFGAILSSLGPELLPVRKGDHGG